MKKKSLVWVIGLLFILTACAATPGTGPGTDLTGLIGQLEIFSEKSVEFKRKAIKIHLGGAMIDVGIAGVLIKKSRHNIPSSILTEVMDSLDQLKIAAQKMKDGIELTDLELGEAAGHAIYVYYQGLRYGVKELAPIVTRFLGIG